MPGAEANAKSDARCCDPPTLSAQEARRMVDAAIAEAESLSVLVAVVIVDESGVTKMMTRMDPSRSRADRRCPSGHRRRFGVWRDRYRRGDDRAEDRRIAETAVAEARA